MNTSRENEEHFTFPTPTRATGAVLVLLLALAFAAASGCAPKSEETSTPAPAPENLSTESAPGGTQTINLNAATNDSCVTFVPKNVTIHVGDRVNFNTNSSTVVNVRVPAGLFSVGDTTISVSRGANNSSPTAQAMGTYPLTSTPIPCSSTTGGSGPSIIVDAGDPATH